jgi:hypothetical protein
MGPVPMGPDTYLISHEGGAGFGGTGGLMADALMDASDYCKKDGLKFMAVNTQATPRGFGVYPRADVQFVCLKEGDARLRAGGLSPTPSSIIEVRSK